MKRLVRMEEPWVGLCWIVFCLFGVLFLICLFNILKDQIINDHKDKPKILETRFTSKGSPSNKYRPYVEVIKELENGLKTSSSYYPFINEYGLADLKEVPYPQTFYVNDDFDYIAKNRKEISPPVMSYDTSIETVKYEYGKYDSHNMYDRKKKTITIPVRGTYLIITKSESIQENHYMAGDEIKFPVRYLRRVGM